MSAIFGILRFDGAEVSARDLERMGNVLAHRGPDGRKFSVDGAVGLGHCLMRVNNEDLFEAQPLHDPKADLTLVADLRIDNREELGGIFGIGAAELRDMPDSALVLCAYKKWGEDCAAHLLGDFAFALWDDRQKKLLLGRDHMGQRQVHYHHSNAFFVFATEIKALWAVPDVPRKLDEQQIGRIIMVDQHSEDGATLFEDICGVSGGSTVSIKADGTLTAHRYWEPRADPIHLDRDESYYIDSYRRIFAEAVECRVRRLLGPPALCLSAGFDSAAIAGLAGSVLTAKGRKLIAISSVMPEDYRGPLPCVRRWVELCRRDMPHLDVRYFVRRDESVFSKLESAFAIADGIPGFLHYILGSLYREAASAGARLIMEGHLGDNTLNVRGGGALAYFLRTGQLRRFVSEFGPHLRMSGHTFWQVLRSDLAFRLAPIWAQRAWQALRRSFVPVWSFRAVAPAFAKSLIESDAVKLSETAGAPRRGKGTRVEMQRDLRNWVAKSRCIEANEAAAYGLDLSRPLADKRVVELGLAIPENLYVKNGRNRYLACRALADIYPPEYQTRRGVQDPMEPDFVGMLRAVQPQLRVEIERLANSAALRKYIDSDRLRKVLGAPLARSELLAAALAFRTFHAVLYISWFRRENS